MFIFILKHLEILLALSPLSNLSDVGSVVSKVIAGLGEGGKEQWSNKQQGIAWFTPHFHQAGNNKLIWGINLQRFVGTQADNKYLVFHLALNLH